jgi:L-ascorbate metabolism protein UlaG (beta-lactamase superfamily)
MRITHLGHACLLVESERTRVLIDPGTYSAGYQDLSDLDAVLVTHQHPDHVDADALAPLLAANTRAVLIAEPETVGALEVDGATALAPGDSRAMGDLDLSAVGGEHARNHDLVPPLGNIGLLIGEAGGPTLFHPGDSYADAPAGVDVLAVPLNAPWTRVSETLAFVRAVSAGIAVPIHDGLLNADGRATYLMHVDKFGPAETEVVDLSDGTTYTV